MSLNTSILEKLATPKPHRKGATEEHIYADNQKARTTAKLVSEVLPPSRTLIQGE
jgi:hypothetical protein